MQRAALVLVFLSFLVAAVLWMSATLLQSRLGAPETDPAAGPPDPPVPAERQEEAPVAGCQETEDRLARIVGEARYCVSDEDCTLFDYGYPIDCMTSVAKARVPMLREEYRRYDEVCEHRVFFDCPTEPFVRLPVCRDNRCVVELDRNETPGDPLTGRLRRRGD